MVVDDQGARVYASGQTLFKGLMAVYTLSGLQIDLNTTDVHLISFSSNRLENGCAVKKTFQSVGTLQSSHLGQVNSFHVLHGVDVSGEPGREKFPTAWPLIVLNLQLV